MPMRLSGALLLAVMAAAARAADSPSQAGDSIATAKKDLASIKAPVGQDSGAALPTLDMKDVGTISGAALPELPGAPSREKEASLDPAKKNQGTGNWLVDAMDKRADGGRTTKGRDKDDLLKSEADLLHPGDREATLGEKDLALAEEAREKDGPKEGTAFAYNPLDSFMGGWISAKDRDLLVPGTKGEGLSGEAGRSHMDLLPGLDAGQGGSFVENLIGPVDSTPFADSRSAPNPYLAPPDLGPAQTAKWFLAPEGAGPAAPGLSDFSRGMSSSGVDPRPLDSSRTFIPDFAQPADDDKYFRQLKRF